MGFVEGFSSQVPIVPNISMSVPAFEERMKMVQIVSITKTQNTARVTRAADIHVRVRRDIREWYGMRTIASDAPSKIMSITDQNTAKAAMVAITMTMNGNWSERKIFMNVYLLYRIEN
jgi:hypothetical protein